MKKKRIFAICMSGMICLSQAFTGSTAKAAETNSDAIYYTNKDGVQMTEDEYNKLTDLFGEDEVEWMSSESAKRAYENCTQLLSSISLNQMVFETIAADGSIKSVTHTISEKQAETILAAEAENPQEQIMPCATVGTAVHNTAMKKITMEVHNTGTLNYLRFSVKNEWKTLPAVRSYDIIAMRPGATSASVLISEQDFEAYQVYDGTKVNYSVSGNHVRRESGATNGKGGIGVSMNLSNTATGSITNFMEAYLYCADPLYSVFGTYQHATEDVTLEQSKKYSFGALGMGSVLVFNNDTIKSKYDNTEGLHVTWDWND